ncbi:MAG: hypothetical protein ILP16_11975 [Spirochaetales bacterium]|nr:hypothetical protein [Spirochaetales bacterium]
MRRALPLLIVILICLVSCAGTGAVSSEEDSGEVVMRISVSDGSNTVVFRLNDSTPAKSLYGMLPLDVAVGDFLYNEKIFYPPEKVDGTDGITGDGDAGDLALYYPWGDIVMYIGPFNSNAGLFLLGTAESGAEYIRYLSGTIHVDRL